MKTLEENLEDLRNGAFTTTATTTGANPWASWLNSGSYTSTGVCNYVPVLTSGAISYSVSSYDDVVTEARFKELSFEQIYSLFGTDPFIPHFVKFFKDFSTLLTEMGHEVKTPEEALTFIKEMQEELDLRRKGVSIPRIISGALYD